MRRRRIVLAMGLGLALGSLGVVLGLTPGWRVFEEGIGQHWLFWLRGPLPPPDDVAIVTLDRSSADRLGLPEKIREWPRDVHARLIDRLAGAGASVIALDLIFEQPRPDPDEDAALARAMHAAGRVVLLEFIREHDRPLEGENGTLAMVTTRRVVRPIPQLADAALAVAPFPLPRLPMLVNHFWTFVPGQAPRATMPAAALHHHLRQQVEGWPGIIEAAGIGALRDVAHSDAGGELAMEMAALRVRFLEQRRTVATLRSEIGSAEAWVAEPLTDLLTGPSARWINFYGPPGRITTWPAHVVLGNGTSETLRNQIAGRAVFVGMAELHSVHEDAFRTVFSQGKVDLAGVEIAATIFANLLEQRTLQPLSGGQLAAVLLAFGVIVAALATLLRAPFAVPAALAFALGYTWLAAQAFEDARWLPVAIPLLVQLPLGLFGGLFLQYRIARRAERNLASGMSFYVPPTVARALAEEPAAASRTELVDGVCFVSDIADFTALADRRTPGEVSRLLNSYFDRVFDTIGAEGGTVTDIVGDGITAFWHGLDPPSRAAACRAALRIGREVERLKSDGETLLLPTRIGLNGGRVMLGGVGGSGRFAYSVIGDVVNTASRLEKLNKHLGTRAIASSATVAHLDGITVRPLGDFVLYGKSERIGLVELVDGMAAGDWIDRFVDAFTAFQAGCLADAAAGFQRILQHRSDGPSRFFFRICGRDPELAARREPDGSVRLLEK